MSKVKVGLVVMACALIAAGNANAGGRSRTPDVFSYISIALEVGDTVSVSCDDTVPRVAFMAQSFTEAGKEAGSTSSGLTWNNSDLYLDGKLATAGVSETLVEGEDGTGFSGFGLGIEAERKGRFRAAWASWGGEPLVCAVQKNGLARTARAGDPAKATYLLPSDFSIGAGVSTPAVGVGPALVLEQDVQGYVFTYLPLRSGVAAARAPDGALDVSPAPFGLIVASPKDGPWTYAVAGGMSIGGAFGATMVLD